VSSFRGAYSSSLYFFALKLSASPFPAVLGYASAFRKAPGKPSLQVSLPFGIEDIRFPIATQPNSPDHPTCPVRVFLDGGRYRVILCTQPPDGHRSLRFSAESASPSSLSEGQFTTVPSSLSVLQTPSSEQLPSVQRVLVKATHSCMSSPSLSFFPLVGVAILS